MTPSDTFHMLRGGHALIPAHEWLAVLPSALSEEDVRQPAPPAELSPSQAAKLSEEAGQMVWEGLRTDAAEGVCPPPTLAELPTLGGADQHGAAERLASSSLDGVAASSSRAAGTDTLATSPANAMDESGASQKRIGIQDGSPLGSKRRRRHVHMEKSPFSTGKYQTSVFAEFGRSASSGVADRFLETEADVDKSDDGISLQEHVKQVHETVQAFIKKDPAKLSPGYDE